MVIGIFGESCTGKSTLAEKISGLLPCEIVTGKDYLRLAKSESMARALFQKKLAAAVDGEHILYVIAEPEHLPLLPEGALRVLVTAELGTIKERFAQRMRGNLPPPVAAMLERKHGCFDAVPHEFHVISGQTDTDAAAAEIANRVTVK